MYIVVFHPNPSLFITASFVPVNLKLSGRAGKGFRVADYSEDMKLLGCGERGQTVRRHQEGDLQKNERLRSRPELSAVLAFHAALEFQDAAVRTKP